MKEKEYACKIAEITQKYTEFVGIDKPEENIINHSELVNQIKQFMDDCIWKQIGFKSKPPFDGDIETLKTFFQPYIKINDYKSFYTILHYFDYMSDNLCEKFIDCFVEDFKENEKRFLNAPNISDDIKQAYKLWIEISELNDTIYKDWEFYSKMNKYAYIRVGKNKRELNL